MGYQDKFIRIIFQDNILKTFVRIRGKLYCRIISLDKFLYLILEYNPFRYPWIFFLERFMEYNPFRYPWIFFLERFMEYNPANNPFLYP
jgi:hypothetical protein